MYVCNSRSIVMYYFTPGWMSYNVFASGIVLDTLWMRYKNKNKNNKQKKTQQQQQNKCSTSLVQRAFPLDNGQERRIKGKALGSVSRKSR